MIIIDGSVGEGGGQILRTALTLSLITQKPFQLTKIRYNRPKPGLQPAHLMAVQAAAKIASIDERKAKLGATELEFFPQSVQRGKYHFRINTAGSTSLVLQTIYLPLLLNSPKDSKQTQIPEKQGNEREPHLGDFEANELTSSEIVIEGGTHVPFSPVFDYLATTWNSYLMRMGISIDLALERYWFYPRGNGKIKAIIPPVSKILPIWDHHDSEQAKVVYSAKLTALHNHRSKSDVKKTVESCQHDLHQLRIRSSLDMVEIEDGPVLVLMLELRRVDVERSTPILFSKIADKNKPLNILPAALIKEVHAFVNSGAAVDEHSADQIILPLMFASGPSRFFVSKISQHLLTNIEIIGKFIDRRIQVQGELDQQGEIQIE